MNGEPEEICIRCGARVFAYERRCPFCGHKLWWGKNDDISTKVEPSDRGDRKDIQTDCT